MCAKLQKATVSVIWQFVCPSAWNNFAPTPWIFMKVDIRGFFETLSRRLKFD
jgi:hypothetical protein